MLKLLTWFQKQGNNSTLAKKLINFVKMLSKSIHCCYGKWYGLWDLKHSCLCLIWETRKGRIQLLPGEPPTLRVHTTEIRMDPQWLFFTDHWCKTQKSFTNEPRLFCQLAYQLTQLIPHSHDLLKSNWEILKVPLMESFSALMISMSELSNECMSNVLGRSCQHKAP